MASLKLLLERSRQRRRAMRNYRYLLKMLNGLKPLLTQPMNADNLSILIDLRREYADFVVKQADFTMEQLRTFADIEMKHWFWPGYAMWQLTKLNELAQDTWIADQRVSHFVQTNLILVGAVDAPEQH